MPIIYSEEHLNKVNIIQLAGAQIINSFKIRYIMKNVK